MTRIKTCLNGFATGYAQLMPWSLIATGVIFLVIFFVWLFWQSDSENEIKADEDRSNAEVLHVNSAVSNEKLDRVEPQVESAGKTSRNAVNRAKKVREKVNSNVNISDAIRKCEEAYGEGECG